MQVQTQKTTYNSIFYLQQRKCAIADRLQEARTVNLIKSGWSHLLHRFQVSTDSSETDIHIIWSILLAAGLAFTLGIGLSFMDSLYAVWFAGLILSCTFTHHTAVPQT